MPFITDLFVGSIYGFAWLFAGLGVMFFAAPIARLFNKRQQPPTGLVRFVRILGAILLLPGVLYLVGGIVLILRLNGV
jgi:hypothetical protein